MSKGIYVAGGIVRFFGRRKQIDPPGMIWHDGLDAVARVLVESSEDYESLRWDGSTVVPRDQAELNALERDKTIAQDSAHFERKREKATLLVLLDEINVLRDAVGLPPRTIKQAKSAYKKKLNR